MSKLIVEMEMPKRCFDCPMHDYVSDRRSPLPSKVRLVCNAHHELTPIPNGDERPSWCPIKGILPDEHGITLLIKDMHEGSEFFNEVRNSNANDYRVSTYYSLRMIDAADAIEQLMAECQQLKEDRRGEHDEQIH